MTCPPYRPALKSVDDDASVLSYNGMQRIVRTVPSSTNEELFGVATRDGRFAAVAGVTTIVTSDNGRRWSRAR